MIPDYDLIIIGAGTSGFPSAKIAARYGKKVLLLGDGAIRCCKYHNHNSKEENI